MKIAVIGGNLLGCATTLDLALVQEHDERAVAGTRDNFEVTLFERTDRLGGNALRSVAVDDDLRVEVGAYRTLPLCPGGYLADLVAAANDNLGTVGLFGKRYAIPGAVVARRGNVNAAKVVRPWSRGSYRKLVRSFAAWDWKDDAYHLIYSGWPALDLIHRLLDNQIWRSVALAGLLYSINRLRLTDGQLPRAMALAQCVMMFAIFVLSPRRVVAMWQQHYSFWGTTIPLLLKHGITPAISRGSTIGFLKHVANMNAENIATCSISVGNLVHRGGLEAYIRGTGDDYVRKFKYERNFVERYMEPVVGWEYSGARLTQVSSLAAHFAMLDGDFANSDADVRLSRITPENATLCTALIDAAKATMDVDVKLKSAVTEIMYEDATRTYVVTYGNGESATFDGVALCASPQEGDMVIDTPLGTSLSYLLGYDRDVEAAEDHAAQEAAYQAEQGNSGNAVADAPVAPGGCSHFAVVVGRANATFFRFASEKLIPDLVQMTHAPGCSRFERIREVSDDRPGVYTVLCGADFESSGLLSEMFEEGAVLKYYEPTAKSRYSHTALPMDKAVDACVPNVVLGNRFVYAAATRKLAKHPEMDAMSAVNVSSLFSRAVQWTVREEKEGEEGEEGEDDEAGEACEDGPEAVANQDDGD